MSAISCRSASSAAVSARRRRRAAAFRTGTPFRISTRDSRAGASETPPSTASAVRPKESWTPLFELDSVIFRQRDTISQSLARVAAALDRDSPQSRAVRDEERSLCRPAVRAEIGEQHDREFEALRFVDGEK